MFSRVGYSSPRLTRGVCRANFTACRCDHSRALRVRRACVNSMQDSTGFRVVADLSRSPAIKAGSTDWLARGPRPRHIRASLWRDNHTHLGEREGLTQRGGEFPRTGSRASNKAGPLEKSWMDHDFCNVDGARRLKQRIEEYWRDRGYDVDIKLIEA